MSTKDLSAYGIGTDIDDEDETLEGADFGNDVTDDIDDAGDDAEEVIEVDPAKQVEDEPQADETTDDDKAEEVDEQPAEKVDDQPAAQEEKPAKAPQKDNRMVPRDRLNQEIAKRRELEAKLAALEAAPKQADKPMTVTTLDKGELKKALDIALDGNSDDAADVLAQVLTSLQPQGAKPQEFTPDQLAAAVDKALANKELANKAEEVLSKYSFLDEDDAENFDADASEMVIDMRDVYIRRGMTPAAALEKAVAYTAKEYGYETAEEVTQPAKQTTLKPKPADIPKKAELANKAPARIPRSSEPKTDAQKFVADMSDDEFDKLSGSALANARGDIL